MDGVGIIVVVVRDLTVEGNTVPVVKWGYTDLVEGCPVLHMTAAAPHSRKDQSGQQSPDVKDLVVQGIGSRGKV